MFNAMKAFFKILLWGIILFPLSAFAQTATEQRAYEIRVEWPDLQGYSEYVTYKVPIYYDKDDNVIKHGPFKVNFRKDLSSRLGQQCIISYIVSGNYVNGKLNGILSEEKSVVIAQGSLKTKGVQNYVNGNPNGTWTYSETAVQGGKTQSLTCSVTIKDNMLVGYNENNGKRYFKINSDKTFSGKISGAVYRNSVNTSKFIRKTGEVSSPDENVKGLINAFMSGTMTTSDLISKGFSLQVESRWLYYYDFSNLSYYTNKLGADHFEKDATTTSLSNIIASAQLDTSLAPAYTLMRVNVLSTEELLTKASSLKNSINISERNDEIGWTENGGVWYCIYYNMNAIQSSEGIWYFTDEAKSKLKDTIKAVLEEKRLEQERIAEEKRLEEARIAEAKRLEEERIAEEKRLKEIERQKAKIQPICDYLVYSKTALSICYGEQAGRYFNPRGLSSTWSLDLEKAIKPLCKIVGCKLVSYEGDVAVLDITKFNKKGNITYRIPVTIVDGKILVTSIDFSKAKVVE